MATKRTPSKASASASAPSLASSPAPLNAALVVAAVGYGFSVLVNRGAVSWPPQELIAGSYTVAGCLALVGPIVLSTTRDPSSEGGLGELAWMAGGLIVWIFNLSAAAQGNLGSHSWITPLDVQTHGLIILALLLAGWRVRGVAWSWSWTNVTGWVLAIFWVGTALLSFVPTRLLDRVFS